MGRARKRGEKKCIQGFVRKHDGKDHMEEPHNESTDDVKMYLTVTGLEGVA